MNKQMKKKGQHDFKGHEKRAHKSGQVKAKLHPRLSTQVHPSQLMTMLDRFRSLHRVHLNKVPLAASSNWFGVDKKSMDVKPLLSDELVTMRGIMRTAFGNKPVAIKMVAAFSLTATVTTGVITTVAIGVASGRIQSSDFSENSSLLALFDEVKIDNGMVEFALYASNPAGGAGAPASTLNRIAFDPTDGTVVGSAVALAELAQSKPIPVAYTGATGGDGPLHRFSFDVPPADVVGSTATVGRAWQDASAVLPVGYIKYYGVSSVITAVPVADGVCSIHTYWRCRE